MKIPHWRQYEAFREIRTALICCRRYQNCTGTYNRGNDRENLYQCFIRFSLELFWMIVYQMTGRGT